MIRPGNELKWSESQEKWAIRIFFLFWLSLFGYVCYKAYVEYTSERKYTVLHFFRKYSDSKGTGVSISYLVNGEEMIVNCFNNDCKEVTVGEKRLGYFFVDDPVFYGIYFNISVPDSVVPPENGWDEIPEYLIRGRRVE
jgi:hypothetical protein